MMLAVKDVGVDYERIRALHGVSLTVGEGELVGLLGTNGAGKSTLLKAVAGVVPCAMGVTTLAGRTISGQSCESIVRQGVATVPEGRRIFASLSVGENLRLGGTAQPDRRVVREQIAAQLERFPVLGRKFNDRAGFLSGGEQQQLAIARALISRPRLLLLDEPSLGLAPVVVDSVFEAIDDLRRDGLSILLVEQHAVRTAELADRVYVLRNGRIVLERARGELDPTTDLGEAYLG